jgi:1,2-phenylacetyl-CoA epoxidase PaaB subunit
MVKPPKDYRWRIYQIKEAPAKLIGSVTAPDEESALRKAIVELKIEHNLRRRLVALRQG